MREERERGKGKSNGRIGEGEKFNNTRRKILTSL